MKKAEREMFGSARMKLISLPYYFFIFDTPFIDYVNLAEC